MSDPTATAPWHAGPDLLRQYAAGRLDPVAQASVEAHVDRCPSCRVDAVGLVPAAELAPVWDAVLVGVRTPRRAWPTRALRRLGLPEVDLVVLRLSGNLVLGFAVAIAACLGFGLTAAQLSAEQTRTAWLALAPLLPALLVAGAYDSTDPLRELADPTPYSKLRVALLRTLIAVVGAVPLVLLMSLVPDIGLSLVAWLLPALAVTSVLLVLLTRLTAAVGIGVVTVVWLLAVGGLDAGDRLEVVTQPLGQVLALLVALAAAGVLAHQSALRPGRTS